MPDRRHGDFDPPERRYAEASCLPALVALLLVCGTVVTTAWIITGC